MDLFPSIYIKFLSVRNTTPGTVLSAFDSLAHLLLIRASVLALLLFPGEEN